MARLVFCDTETTALRHDRRAWEIAIIVREPGKPDREHQWFVDMEDLDLGNADPKSLAIGRFHDRHPDFNGFANGWMPTKEREVMAYVEQLTRGAVLIGAVPSFDADVLGQRLRANGLCPSWHYRPLCVETMALGWLAAFKAHGDPGGMPELPWRSSAELSEACGVEPASDDEIHTALGDARWAARFFDAVTGGYYRNA